MYDEKLWAEVLVSLRKRINDDSLVRTWLEPAKIIADRGDELSLVVPNKFFKNWIEKKYLAIILSILKDEFGIDTPLAIICDSVKSKPATPKKEKPAPAENSNISFLDSKLTFENFISGESNDFAYSASRAVAEGNFNIYNPLYIYGSTGLGKTHLMYAIANRIRINFPKMKILCMDSEAFSQEIINLFTKGAAQDTQTRVEAMKARFRGIDLFMLDDIQFMKSREKSLEFFFNIFNDFQAQGKQVVITSDESPQEINMAERMRSRFASGFQAEIQPPNLEERVAILLQKAHELDLSIDEPVAVYIAENAAPRNIRELIGALKYVCIVSSFYNKPATIESAHKALADRGLLKKESVVVSPQHVITIVSEMYNVKLSDIVSKKRTQNIVHPRQVAMFLLRDKLNLSLKEIGGLFGGRDHSTVKYAVDSIKDQLETDEFLKNHMAKIVDRAFR